MKLFFKNFSIKWNIYIFELFLLLQKYLTVFLFLAVAITFILDIVNLCQSIVDHMSFFNVGDSSLYMSSGTGAGSGAGTSAGT
jgi:hypothetical protein